MSAENEEVCAGAVIGALIVACPGNSGRTYLKCRGYLHMYDTPFVGGIDKMVTSQLEKSDRRLAHPKEDQQICLSLVRLVSLISICGEG